MTKMNLQDSFIKFCKQNKLEINSQQTEIIDLLDKFLNRKEPLLNRFFKKKKKLCFYLYGKVGVGKTMLLNFVYDRLKVRKYRQHFNEFMINFHDFRHENKDNNAVNSFVKKLKEKYDLIYLDEFQVTNIVDAMILGRLFKKIFDKKIKVIFSSNIKIKNLYKDGLQRDQFIPFIKILKNNSLEKELFIEEDYRTNKNNKLDRFLYPINQSTNFKLNKFFRKITKNKNKTLKILKIKGRSLEIKNFYDNVIKFDFNELCNKNLGSEDYIGIANICNFIFIENLPDFNEDNSNQQQRFVTLIDIIYEKKIPLMITSQVNLESISSSKSMEEPFKRTVSRLYELTSMNFN